MPRATSQIAKGTRAAGDRTSRQMAIPGKKGRHPGLRHPFLMRTPAKRRIHVKEIARPDRLRDSALNHVAVLVEPKPSVLGLLQDFRRPGDAPRVGAA